MSAQARAGVDGRERNGAVELRVAAREGAARMLGLTERVAAFRAAFPDWRRPWRAADFVDFAGDPRVLWLEARLRRRERGDLFAGLLLARRIGDEVEVLTLFRAPNLQQKGVGALLIEQLIHHFTETGIERITLEVGEQNVRALSLYQRFGFVKVGRRPGYYQPCDGPRQDALILSLDFSGSQ